MEKKQKKKKNQDKYIRLRIPIKMYGLMKDYKDMTGVSITSQVHESVVSWLFIKKIIGLKDIQDIKNNKKEKKNV